jgi:glutathione S-transferase
MTKVVLLTLEAVGARLRSKEGNMVQLVESDIRTREVLGWKGLHVFHFPRSSCSQKLRIFLNLKGVKWKSHIIDLFTNENLSESYLGINPRGLVPALVHDGAVYIESNDILVYLEERFPEPKLIPTGSERKLAALLTHEDELHFDLQALSFRFVFAPPMPPKSPEDLKRFAAGSSGTVQGTKDAGIAQQIDFWERFAKAGVTDERARASALKSREAFVDLEQRLGKHPYPIGDTLSILDIAWFIYANRLLLAAYPIARLHPRLSDWYGKLLKRPEFSKEIELPPPLKKHFDATRIAHAQRGKSLELVAGL